MAKSWTRVAKIRATYEKNIITNNADGTTETKTKPITENITILGNTTAVHFFGENWSEWVGTDKIDEYTIPAGTTTTRERDGEGGYKYNQRPREAYDVTRPASSKRIGAGKKVVLYTGAYGTKSANNSAWVPKTVTFQFPAWLKNRDVLAGIRVLCDGKINDTDKLTKVTELTPYCRINGVKYRIPPSAAVTAQGKITKATATALQNAKDNSEKPVKGS